MRHRLDQLGVATLVLLVGLGPLCLAEHDVRVRPRPVAPDPDERAARVDARLREIFQSGTSAPGCSFSVRVNGRRVFQKSYGSAGKTGAATPSTRYWLASVSKPLVAIGLLALRDELRAPGGESRLPTECGRNLLSCRLGAIYPELAGSGLVAAITVRQLLQHTSGLTREIDSTRAVPDRIARYLKSVGGLVSRPGTRWAYSNLGYMLAANILTKLSGMDWRRYLQVKIFDPLGMTQTRVTEDPVAEQRNGKLAQGFHGGSRSMPMGFGNRRWFHGSAGVLSTVQDLDRLAEAVEKRKILSEDTWREALSPYSGTSGTSYGLGWELRDGTDVWHDGIGGGFLNRFQLSERRYPPCRFSAAILCNVQGGMPPEFGERVDPASLSKYLRDVFCAIR